MFGLEGPNTYVLTGLVFLASVLFWWVTRPAKEKSIEDNKDQTKQTTKQDDSKPTTTTTANKPSALKPKQGLLSANNRPPTPAVGRTTSTPPSTTTKPSLLSASTTGESEEEKRKKKQADMLAKAQAMVDGIYNKRAKNKVTTPIGGGGVGRTKSAPAAAVKKSGPDALLVWCKNVTVGYEGVNITNFTKSFWDGLAFAAIAHHFRPDLIDFKTLDPANKEKNLKAAFDAFEKMGVPRLLDEEDMVDIAPEKLSVITYLSEVHRRLRSNE